MTDAEKVFQHAARVEAMAPQVVKLADEVGPFHPAVRNAMQYLETVSEAGFNLACRQVALNIIKKRLSE